MTDTPETAPYSGRTDGSLLRDLVRGYTRALETNRETLNSLNVFPVPDGDTGTNMLLTMRTVLDELDDPTDTCAGEISRKMARAALLGARGNSGLILAQYFKGLAEALAESRELTALHVANGLKIASDTAYDAVPTPREGTMLTVFRECAEAAKQAVNVGNDLQHVLKIVAEQAMDTVRRTPEMLDVLKDAGVVDSGGFGFAVMLHSSTELLSGKEPGLTRITPPGNTSLHSANTRHENSLNPNPPGPAINSGFLDQVEEEDWGYCTVFAIEGENLDANAVREQMSKIGKSPVVAGSDTLLKVHVHMEDPGPALTAGVRLGTLSNIEISNMDEQAKDWAKQRNAESAAQGKQFQTAVTAVALGEGFTQLFQNAGLGAVHVLTGGDTMNPSTAEIVKAIDRTPSESVILLPNNKNVVGTARQAAEISTKNVHVIESRSMQAGLAALMEFSPDREIQKNKAQMAETLSIVRCGSVSMAIRDALLDGIAVRTGQYMGILDEKLVAAGDNPVTVLVEMLRGQADEESLLTLYAGSEVDAQMEAIALSEISKTLPGVEVEILIGGQPDHAFLLAIE